MVHEQMELILENVFFYWKGSKAPKGLSPLPPDIDNETAIVNRIVQWSEPAVFFHLFEKNRMIVFEENFNPSSPHLFIVRGELSRELHLYEVPFMKKNLRSRGVFVIAVPQTRSIYVWTGSKITNELNEVVKEASLGVTVRNYVDSWKNFEILEMKENEEDDLFVEDSSEYWHVKEVCNFSPKLFFLNTIIGEFAAIEVEYPLRSKDCVAAFPFLQSYLSISDDQPGYFLLDNNHEIWLITCDLKPSETLRELEALASQFARSYTEEKEKMLSVSIPLKFVKLDSVPIEFTNIFPHWN
ncbi:unnamed protein product [Diabrotica balteata]|uniref:Gelsolin n=1 Tax=Diabrotica balteata TaxID=107213 RepID=A0A9N9TBW3_DIABA|nr:unnamed protein product [Diabrotica balteata]